MEPRPAHTAAGAARWGAAPAHELLGAGAAGSGIALMATSAWLISRAAQHPSVVALGVAIVGVQFFSLSRGSVPLQGTSCRPRHGATGPGRPAGPGCTNGWRAWRPRPAGVSARGPVGAPRWGRGCIAGPDAPGHPAFRDRPRSSASRRSALYGTSSRLPAWSWRWRCCRERSLVPWCTLRLARRREARQAAARGELSTHVVDLLEGAPELVAFGAVEAQLARVSAADAELTRIATATSRTAGVGAGLITLLTGLAVWGSCSSA